MTIQEYMYRIFRKAGMTLEGACAVLAQIQHEGAFKPTNAENSKGIADDVYTREVDNGTRTRHSFMYDGVGYGYAQWTFPDRKGKMYDFHRARGKSIGDSDTQIMFLLWEMQHDFPNQWTLVTHSHDIADISWQLLDKWENPNGKKKQKPIREKSAKEFYEQFRNLNVEETHKMTKEEAVDLVLNTAREEVGYHEKASDSMLDDKNANSGFADWNKYARDLDRLKNFYNSGKNGYMWCFTSGTLILTDNGYKKIEEIVPGDRVLNAFGDGFNNVLDTSFHDAEVVDARVYGNVPFSVTPDHPFLSEKRINKWHRSVGYQDRGFHPLAELDKNDAVVMPKSPVLYDNNMPYDDLWMLGYYVGDGYRSQTRYKVCANDKKAEEVEKHIDGRRDNDYASRTCIEYELHWRGHESLFDALDSCGQGAVNKTIPPCILFGTDEAKQAFLDGYLTADGCGAFDSFNSVSASLISGLSRIFFDLGIPCSVNVQKRPEEGRIFDARKNEYRTFKQQSIIYNCSLNRNSNRSYQIHTEFDDYNLVPIREISEETHVDTVYTIFVDGDHTYTANNIGVHNCDIFVDWLFVKCFGAEIGRQMLCQPLNSAGAGCKFSAQYYKQYGRWHNGTPEPGDQIFFTYAPGEYSHTGIVESVSGGVVNTIEGNVSDSVGRRSYAVGSQNITGYGRPRWELATNANSDSVIFPDSGSSGERILKIGKIGDDVKKLQEDLMKLGYDVGPDGADGDYGDNTMLAVMKFQRDKGLTPVDGEAGDDTRKALKEALDESKLKEEPSVKPEPSTNADDKVPYKKLNVRTIKMEDEGPDVKLAQAALQCWGYTIVATGIFGKEMDEKIRNFQKAKGLDADGEIGPETWKKLLEV